jgi:hypothetical protein
MRSLTPEQKQQILQLGKDFPRLWKAPTTSACDRKRMLRLLVRDITVVKGAEPKLLHLQIRWQGRASETIDVHRQPNRAEATRYPDTFVVKIRTMLESDPAYDANREGLAGRACQPFAIEPSDDLFIVVLFRHRIHGPTTGPKPHCGRICRIPIPQRDDYNNHRLCDMLAGRAPQPPLIVVDGPISWTGRRRLHQQRLAGTGRADQQGSAWRVRPQGRTDTSLRLQTVALPPPSPERRATAAAAVRRSASGDSYRAKSLSASPPTCPRAPSRSVRAPACGAIVCGRNGRRPVGGAAHQHAWRVPLVSWPAAFRSPGLMAAVVLRSDLAAPPGKRVLIPPKSAAAARRACQGWPRLRGHPKGLALTGPSTAACSSGSGLEADRNLRLAGG